MNVNEMITGILESKRRGSSAVKRRGASTVQELD